MAKLTVNKKYQELFDTVDRYQQALNKKKKEYLQSAREAEAHSTAQTDAFDAAFILDFMMASNQQLIDYLDFLQKCNNSVMNQTLDKVTNLLSKDEDINSLISSINNQITKDNELILKQRNYYWLRALLSFSIGITFLAGATAILCTLLSAINPLGLIAAAIAIVAISGLIVRDSINSESKYHSITGHSENWSHRNLGNHNNSFIIDIKTESVDKKTMDNRLLTRTLSESKTTLRNNFFNEKYSSGSGTFADAVNEEYTALMP